MAKKCELTQKKANNAYNISHSHKRNKRLQNANLQWKRLWCEKHKKWIKMRVSTKALKKNNYYSLQQLIKHAN